MSGGKQVVNPWTEKVTFIACPSCEEVDDLGSGAVISNGEEWTCPKCGEEFELGEVEDE